jgi:hypothetical protein
MSLMVPILHAGGFSWDEALVLVVAILAVPAISFFTGRFGRRQDREPSNEPRRRTSRPADDDVAPDSKTIE